MSQTYIKNFTCQDKKPGQHNLNMAIRKKQETTLQNKVTWQKNILPGGRVDWVIVGFGVPTPVKKEVDARIKDSEICEKNDEIDGDIFAATVPLEPDYTVKKEVLGLIVGEVSKRLVADNVDKQDTTTTEYFTKNIVVSKKKVLGCGGEGMNSGEPSKRHEAFVGAMVGLETGGKPVAFKDSRDRSVSGAPLTPAEIFKPSKWLSQVTPAASRNMSTAASRSSGGPDLRSQSKRESRTTSPKLTTKRARSNTESRNTSPKSTPAKKSHPAGVRNSFHYSETTNKNYPRPLYSPIFNQESSKARLTTPIPLKNSPTSTIRPKTSVNVASRMITHALGLRPISRGRTAGKS